MRPCSSPPEVAAGQVVTAAITNAAVDSLELTVGANASDVMVAAG